MMGSGLIACMADTATKATLRRSLLSHRKQMSRDDWREKSDRLCARLQQMEVFRQARTILAYFSIRNEPDLTPLFHLDEYRWGFPRCVGKDMAWHHWSPQQGHPTDGLPLQAGAFGIQEPHPDAPMVSIEVVDLILVPAVACDRRGHRLGYGGGFYDRFLSLPAWQHKPTIGIVFSDHLLPTLPVDDWDRPLHSICTDQDIVIA